MIPTARGLAGSGKILSSKFWRIGTQMSWKPDIWTYPNPYEPYRCWLTYQGTLTTGR